MGASEISTFGCLYGIAIAVPTDEQNRTRAGEEDDEERERFMRFCKEASCDVNDRTGSAKFTSHAQWMICVNSDLTVSRTVVGSPRLALERSDDKGTTFSDDNAPLRLRASRASSSLDTGV